jgi:signal transduction histidine kinase/CheY-like chemotaxis protein
VFRAQLEFHHRLTERSHLAAFAISTLFLVALPTERSRTVVAAWWLALNLVGFLRIFLGRCLLSNRLMGWSLEQWERTTVLGALGSGLSWGFFLAFLGPPWGDPAYPIAVFMAAGIPAVSLLANSGVIGSYVSIVVPILLPYSLKLMFFSNSKYEFLGGVAALVYAVVFLGLGWAVNRAIVESFRLRFQNEDLVQSLSAANTDLASEIAAREATELGLREARASADAANAAKSGFLARMSHEIRTPLNGILGMSEILKTTPLSADQAEHAETIQEAGRSLLHVINDILDFSKVEAGKLSLRASDFSVREVVERAVALLRPQTIASGLRLEIEISPDVPSTVNGDAGRLRQILINLIGNARKFTREGSIHVKVSRTSANGDPHDLLFEVTDTGIGIPKDAQKRLFQAFAQVDESNTRPHGGTGLGLAISQQLVELMNGTLGVDSEVGKGSRFWFNARFHPPNRSAELRRPREFSEADLVGSLRGHVLLVDDNHVNRLVGASFLQRLGCTFEEAEDGETAVRRVGERPFDLVLMDCQMPGVDGYEATSRIRLAEEVERAARKLPIVALTASALATDRERAMEAGMSDHLSKPFSLVDLHRVISPFLAATEGRPPAGLGSTVDRG